MDFFRDLGLTILDRWRKLHLDHALFPGVACAVLRDCPPSAQVEALDVVRWVHAAPHLPPQLDRDATFGEPPVGVFHCEHFCIEVLFWLDGTTAIHDHAFSGAFHVLEGSSLHSEYAFTAEHRYGDALSAGRLEHRKVELLRQGDVRPILAGSSFVHSLFHLDRPSVSVVVRTPSDPRSQRQFNYLRAGLAVDGFAKTDSTLKKVQTATLLHQLNCPTLEDLVRESIRGADAFAAFQILTCVARLLEKPELVQRFVERIRPHHDRLLDAVVADARNRRREKYIIARRRLAKDREHRFLLAMLLNLQERTHIIEVVSAAFPDRNPIDSILDWIAQLAKLDRMNAWVSEVANVAGDGASRAVLDVTVDAMTLDLLRAMLDGRTNEEAIAYVESRATGGLASSRADAFAKCARLRGSELLGPLVAPPPAPGEAGKT